MGSHLLWRPISLNDPCEGGQAASASSTPRLLKYSCIVPSQSPLVLGAENLSCTHLACPGTPPASHPSQGAPCSGVQGPTIPSDPSSQMNNRISLGHTDNRESIQTVLQPGRLQGSQTSSDTYHKYLGPQPKPGATVPTVNAALEVGEDGVKGGGAAQRKKHHCGVCGHLLLAVVLAVFSPLVAVGVCMADILTGECCNVQDMDSVDDP